MKTRDANGRPQEIQVSLAGFELQSLEILDSPKIMQWTQLQQLDLQNNLLSSLDYVENLSGLRFLNASYNYIDSIDNLKLPNLERLILHSNGLRKFPLFEYMLKLKELVLSSNQISDLHDLNPDFSPSIQILDLRNNKFHFTYQQEFTVIMSPRQLGGLKKLVKLDLSENKCMELKFLWQWDINKITFILKHLPQMRILNGKKRQDLIVEMQEHPIETAKLVSEISMIDTTSELPPDTSMSTIVTSDEKKRKKGPIMFTDMLDKLEKANTHTARALDHLKDLALQVDQAVKNKKKLETIFKGDEAEVRPQIENFIMYAELLIEVNPEMQSIMLSILAKLSIISSFDFGLSCFNMLCDQMKSGETMQSIVRRIICNEIIPQLDTVDIYQVSSSLLEGLLNVTKETWFDENTESILQGLYDTSFPMWLESYRKVLESSLKSYQVPRDDDEHYDLILELIAVSITNQTNMELFWMRDLHEVVSEILKMTIPNKARYVSCLKIIKVISSESGEAEELADYFIDSMAHVNIINEINTRLTTLRKSGTILEKNAFEKKSGSNNVANEVVFKLQAYQTLQIQIECLGSLLNGSKKMQIIGDGETNQVILDLLKLTTGTRVDPTLLTAICKFAVALFTQEEVNTNEELVRELINCISNPRNLFEYVGGHSYFWMLDVCRAYMRAERVQSVGGFETASPSEMAMQSVSMSQSMSQSYNASVVHGGKKQTNTERIDESLRNLDNEMCMEAMIAIIDLVCFFCEEASRNEEVGVFLEFSLQLDKCGRDDALFRALVVQDDGVKLAIVKCLLKVPLVQFDDEEVGQIVTLLQSCNNVSAGQMELVISGIYWIFYRFLNALRTTEDEDEVPISCNIFLGKYAEQVIAQALDVLELNLQRVSDDTEDSEKYILSMSVLQFLKIVSVGPLGKQLKRKNHELRKLLKLEELYSSERIKQVPIDLENTQLGSDVITLMNCLVHQEKRESEADDPVVMYCDVSYRILSRVGDLLMNRNQFESIEVKDASSAEDVLFEAQSSQYAKQIAKEKSFFWDVPERWIQNLSKEEYQNLKQQHASMKDMQAIDVLLRLFLGPQTQNELYITELLDSKFKMTDQDIKTMHSLKSEIYGEKQKIEEQFRKTYVDGDNYSVRKAFLADALKHYKPTTAQKKADKRSSLALQGLSEEQIKIKEEEPEWYEEEDKLDETDTKLDMFQSNNKIEELGDQYSPLTEIRDNARKEAIERKFQEIRKAMKENPALSGQELNNLEKMDQNLDEGMSSAEIREARGDGFLNRQLRSLNVAALLRIVFALIEYSPTIEMKMATIRTVRKDYFFKAITMLCDSTHWDEKAGIVMKYLRIMRHVIKTPIDREYEEPNMLMHYEWVAHVIQKALVNIVTKMKNDIPLTNGDKVRNYEISLMIFTLVKQANYFNFSKLDLVLVYREKEMLIQKFSALTKSQIKRIPAYEPSQNGPLMGSFANTINVKTKKPVKKCEDFGTMYGDKDGKISQKPELYKLRIPVGVLRTVSTVQESVVEHMIMKIFRTECIYSLLDILFADMRADQQIFQTSRDETLRKMGNAEESATNNSMAGESGAHIEAEEKMTEAELELQEYVTLKSMLTIERIKDSVGEIMTNCRSNMRYNLIERLMTGVIFQGMDLRESFLQETLNAQDSSKYRQALQFYINQNNFKIYQSKTDHQDSMEVDENNQDYEAQKSLEDQRVIEHAWVDLLCNLAQDANKGEETPGVVATGGQFFDGHMRRRLFVLTNHGIQIFRDLPLAEQCMKCPESSFCPRGPYQEFVVKLTDIQSVVSFPNIPQKLVIRYRKMSEVVKPGQESGAMETEQAIRMFEFTLNVPACTKASKIFKYLTDMLYESPRNLQSQENSDDELSNIQIATPGQMDVSLDDGKETQRDKQDDREADFMNTDQVATYDLWFLLSQLACVESETKQLFQFDQMKQVRLLNVSINYINIISPEMYESEILNPQNEMNDRQLKGNKIMHALMQKNLMTQLQPGTTEKESNQFYHHDDGKAVEKACFVCIFNNQILLIRERWAHNWKNIIEYSDLLELKKQYMQELDGLSRAESIKNYKDCEDQDKAAGRMENFVKTFKRGIIFNIVAAIPMNEVTAVDVHTTSSPSIDILCYRGGFKGKVQIQFSGDFERQLFIEEIWENHKLLEQGQPNQVQFKEREEKQAFNNNDSDAEEDSSSSEEEEFCQMKIYD